MFSFVFVALLLLVSILLVVSFLKQNDGCSTSILDVMLKYFFKRSVQPISVLLYGHGVSSELDDQTLCVLVHTEVCIHCWRWEVANFSLKKEHGCGGSVWCQHYFKATSSVEAARSKVPLAGKMSSDVLRDTICYSLSMHGNTLVVFPSECGVNAFFTSWTRFLWYSLKFTAAVFVSSLIHQVWLLFAVMMIFSCNVFVCFFCYYFFVIIFFVLIVGN